MMRGGQYGPVALVVCDALPFQCGHGQDGKPKSVVLGLDHQRFSRESSDRTASQPHYGRSKTKLSRGPWQQRRRRPAKVQSFPMTLLFYGIYIRKLGAEPACGCGRLPDMASICFGESSMQALDCDCLALRSGTVQSCVMLCGFELPSCIVFLVVRRSASSTRAARDLIDH